jgi:hypothetical protein
MKDPPSGEAAWDTFSMSYGPTKALAGNLDEARRAELLRDFIASTTASPPNSVSVWRASTC